MGSTSLLLVSLIFPSNSSLRWITENKRLEFLDQLLTLLLLRLFWYCYCLLGLFLLPYFCFLVASAFGSGVSALLSFVEIFFVNQWLFLSFGVKPLTLPFLQSRLSLFTFARFGMHLLLLWHYR